MASRTSKKRSIRDLMNDSAPFTAQHRIIHELDKDTDANAVLISTSYLDQAITYAITIHFAFLDNKNFKHEFDLMFSDEKDGPLSNLASKCRIAYALGIIGDTPRADFRIIRQIRNAFAHPMKPVTFETPELRDSCFALVGPEKGIDMKRTGVNFIRRHLGPKHGFLLAVLHYHWRLHRYIMPSHPSYKTLIS